METDDIEETILWKIIGIIMFIGCVGLITIFLLLIEINTARYFNYTVSAFGIGILVSLFFLLLIYKLVNTILNKFEIE